MSAISRIPEMISGISQFSLSILIDSISAVSNLCAQISPFAWTNPNVQGHDTLLGRVREVWPGRLLHGSNLSEENRAVDLLAPLMGQGLSEDPWSANEIQCVHHLIQKIITSVSSLRGLEYRDQADFFFLKGMFKLLDPSTLERKIESLAIGLEEGNQLTSEECGFLECATKWVGFLQKLEAKGIEGLGPFIEQWSRVSQLSETSTIQTLKQKILQSLTQDPVCMVLAGKGEWLAFKRHTDLSAMSFPDMIKHIFTGDATHSGFIASQEELGLKVSHQIHKHLLHPPADSFNGAASCLFFNFSIKSLINPNIGEEDRNFLQAYFLKALNEKSLIQRELSQKSMIGCAFSHVFGAKTLFTTDFSPPKQLRCTGFVAMVLLEAWNKTNLESIKRTKRSLRPIFGAYDATDRMTIPQLLKSLKDKNILSPIEQPWIKQDRLRQIWKNL